MNKIDVHLITHNEPQWQIDRCLESLKDEPVTLHIVQGFYEWPPYQGRALGYSKGTAPYVSYVDPDDYLVPGAFTKLLTAIESGDYDAAYGWERIIKKGQLDKVAKTPHHAFVLKRGLPIDYSSEWRVFIDRHGIKRNRIIMVNEVLYFRDMGER